MSIQQQTSEYEQPIRSLTCCVCGEPCRGRQWHNRDTGFGLCSACAVRPAVVAQGAAEMRELYGIAGVHYFKAIQP